MPKLREKLAEESGYAMVMTALGFFMLLGFMALAIDTGMMFQAKRKLQTAADAAATAAALDYMYNGNTTTAIAAGKSASASNGYTDGSSGVTVTVNDPPSIGPNSGAAATKGFFEAIVSQPVPTLFMATVGFKTMNITTRAVAGTPAPGDVCIWVMADSGASMNLQGSYDVEAPGCGIYVNSPGSDAFSTTGNGGTVHAKFLDVVGNSPPAHQTNPTQATINTVPRTSPWGDVTGPNPADGTCTVDSTTTSITGTYAGPGDGNAVCFTKQVNVSSANLGPGIYAFGNGVNLSGTDCFGCNSSGTITGHSMIDIYGGSFNQGNAVLDISAYQSGSYNAISIMQPVTNTNQLQVQFGSSNQTLDGYIYAPGAQVYLQDNGGGTTALGIVAKTFYVKASTVRIPSYDLAHAGSTPNRVVSMVE